MKLTVIGCSGSFAGPDSPASSYLVQAEHEGRTWSIVLDLGNGALGPLQRHVDPADLDAVFVSHLHPDHCVDICGLYVTRKYRPGGAVPGQLDVHAPTGASDRFALMYHGLEHMGMSAEFAVHELADELVTTVGPFTVTSYRVNHPVEAYGFRVEADGAVLAYTGDTDATDALTPLLAGADLALMDSAFVDGRDDAEGIHLSGRRAAEAAVAAGGVERIVLTHIPSWNDPQVCRAQAAEVWSGPLELAAQDSTWTLGQPVGALGDRQGPVQVDRTAGLAMYADYLAAHPEVVPTPASEVAVECFGDSPELADELVEFIVGGTKRATASLVAGYAADEEPLPKVGAHWVCCDGSGRPRAVLRTWEIRLGPFRSVDERFAWDEGEYDRTLESWLEGHRRAHGREAARLGIEFTEDLEVCFERFSCVWPPELAD
ncbi:MBL fold metallo-hydrolase [Pedococcus sp. KACC 23699]|uniref:MBL fold metallo-hydrolase n=2 Tax=Pedococcus sp. KACC 23699 TaxID=3149228 RepID=A0AAU7JUJ7_9MICO